MSRRSAAAGASAASATISSSVTASEGLRSGKSASAVAIALACTSGPDMRLPAAVACSSWSTGAVAPTTTTLPRTAAGSKWPLRTSVKDRFVTVPGGPRKSIQPPSSRAAGTGWRCSSCETTAAIVGSPLTWASVWRSTPSPSAGRSEAATRSPMLATLALPPSTCVWPVGEISDVANTTGESRLAASSRASSSGSSVAWSNAMS